jgi:hypothetical protein
MNLVAASMRHFPDKVDQTLRRKARENAAVMRATMGLA